VRDTLKAPKARRFLICKTRAKQENTLMKIVVLDGYTLNPGDISWEGVQKCGDLTVHERTPKNKTVERVLGAQIALTNKVLLMKPELDALPDLKYIGVLATGYNVVDLQECARRGITVTNIPSYSTYSVAQTTFAHILNIANNVAGHSASARGRGWCESKDFSYCVSPLTELFGLKLGIVGYGQIGKIVAKIAEAFGMEVCAYAPSRQVGSRDSGVKFETLEKLFKCADILSLNCPLTEGTRHMVNKKTLALMKPSAWIINTGRGPLIDEDALAEALNAGRIAAAGVDVLSTEPPSCDNPLLSAKNCYITPHNSWASVAARKRLMGVAADNIKAWQKGQPINVVVAK